MKYIKNIVLFFVGFSFFIMIEQIYRANTYIISGIMGGLSMILLDKINDNISWDMDLRLQCLIGTGIITTIEFIVGVLDRVVLHLNMWDYSSVWGNLWGIICIPFSICWFFLSGVAIVIADIINYHVFDGEKPHYHIGRYYFEL